MSGAKRILVGAITGARGLGGEVRIKSFTDDPSDIAAYGDLTDQAGERVFSIRLRGSSKGALIARIEGVNDRTAAEDLKGTELYLARDQLPAPADDEFYHADLVGLPVRSLDGRTMGTVRSLDDFGAGEVMEILLESGKPLVVPFSREAVPEIDLDRGYVVVDPPEGLSIDGAEQDDGLADENEENG